MRTLKFIIPVVLLIIISSCTKKEIEIIDEPQKVVYNSISTKEILDAQNTFDIPNNMMEESYDKLIKGTFGYRGFECVEISKSNSFGHFPNTFTFDFGTGCDINDSLNFSGKILITFSGFFNHSGDSIVFEYDNFYVNGTQLEGKFIKKNLGKDADGNRRFSKQVINAKVTKETGESTSFNSLKYSKYYNNGTHFDISDDEFGFTGNFEGITYSGDTYLGVIRDELILPLSCGCIVSGKLEISYNYQDIYTLDYGNGDCDSQASLTYPDGTTENIDICK